MMRRRRRNPFLRPVELSDDQDGDDYEYGNKIDQDILVCKNMVGTIPFLQIERKRRGIYLYPMMDNFSWWDKRGNEKRGTPFYFPFSYFKPNFRG